jgi:two-component system, OmpR family, sensor kinase
MTLSSRLSWFFLAALALALLGFSVALYALAHVHLHRQLRDRLEAALNTLVAAAEIEPDCVEWEPNKRRFAIDPAQGGSISWEIQDANGLRIDGSSATDRIRPFEEPQSQVLTKRLQPDGVAQRSLKPEQHSAVVIMVAAPLAPVRATLRWLALVLAGLSLGLWTSAALLGRRLCRRALRPLTDMALAAQSITAADLGQRLPPAATGDKLEELGRAFNDLLSRLEESFERQRRFTGDASHQLRTPLTAMLGQVEVALRHDRDRDEYRRVLGLVQKQTGRLRQIVEALLFLSRADTESAAPPLEQIELGPWLEEHLAGWETHPRAADLRPEFSGALWAEVHPPLLGQALDNLLDNACKYSSPGSPVAVRLRREEETICLEVEDRGCGIDADDLPHIFEPFYRSRAVQRSAGVGLGLAVAGRIIASFGGRMDVSSTAGKGTKFTVRLPAASPAPPGSDGRP